MRRTAAAEERGAMELNDAVEDQRSWSTLMVFCSFAGDHARPAGGTRVEVCRTADVMVAERISISFP
jgi:hypothetical protein